MTQKGKRKYVCRDCGASRLIHWVELNRRASPRCTSCGGILDPGSDGAIEDVTIRQMNLREPPRGDVKRAGYKRRSRRSFGDLTSGQKEVQP
jgi:DNA-directed RNA polymerase subunit RPC12/RpoP